MDNLLRGIHVNEPTGNQGSDCMCIFMSVRVVNTHLRVSVQGEKEGLCGLGI